MRKILIGILPNKTIKMVKRKINFKKKADVEFEKICKDIRDVKIQGARNIAKSALKALLLKNDKNSIKKLISLRPTEPLLFNSLFRALSFKEINHGVENSLEHFENTEKEIAKHGANIIRDGDIVFTHCHSSSVVNILIEAKKQGKNFMVYNTETRPLFQGRKTSTELAKQNIPVTHIIDSAARHAIKHSTVVLFGADAITNERIYNKIGSELYAILAKDYGIPIFIAADAWKYYSKKDDKNNFIELPIERRPTEEIWKNPQKGVRIENPAFEKINPALIEGIISEMGILPFREFLFRVSSRYPWLKEVKF